MQALVGLIYNQLYHDKVYNMTILEIPVETEIAQIYAAASENDRRKLAVMVQLWLRELASPTSDVLGDIMDRISATAQARGLTPDILAELLNDDE